MPFVLPRPVDSRSPFVRLTELIGHIAPGKPPISLAVGEPQHPIPSFVGPVLAAHLAEFGKLSAEQGHRRASAARPPPGSTAATSCRARSIRRREVLVLSGTREGLFLRRHRRQALRQAARRASPRC